MQILPKLKCKFGEAVGVEIFITPPDIRDNQYTFITADASSAATDFAVDNGLKIAVKNYIVTGNIGAEKTEILRTHDSTTPTALKITLNATTSSHAHSRGERIQFIPYNQVVIEKSTDGITYTAFDAIDIRVDAESTYYNDTSGLVTYYYRARFKNEEDTEYSEYSDGLIATGFADNSVGKIINDALISLGENVDNEVLTKEFLYTALNEGRNEIDRHQMIEKWSFRTVFDFDAGDIIPGQYKLTLPTNLRDPATYKNILAIRIGKSKYPLKQVDKRTLNYNYEGVSHTTLDGAVLITDTSIVLTSSGDFNESGSIDIAGASIAGTIDNVDYTANTESTDTLSGVTNIATGGHVDDVDVWQGASFGMPQEYTVDDGVMFFACPFNDDLAGENIWLDYYKEITNINSDGDTLDEPFYEIYKPYLRYRIKLRKNPQMNRNTDPDFMDWVEKRESQVNKEWLAQDIRIIIDIP